MEYSIYGGYCGISSLYSRRWSLKTIIAGSRDITDYKLLEVIVPTCQWFITEVVSGGARGVDTLAERYAKDREIPLKVFKADWNAYGKSAGYWRNDEMAKYADALLALWDGKSRGTRHMIDLANKYNLELVVHLCEL